MIRASHEAEVLAMTHEDIAAAALRIEARLEERTREAAARRAVVLAPKPRKRRGGVRSPECRRKQRAATFGKFAASVGEDAPALRRLRVEQGLTLPELAARASLSRTAVWDAENRPERTRERTWRKLSWALFGSETEWRTLRDG